MNIWIVREAESLSPTHSRKYRYLGLTDSLTTHSHGVTLFTSSFDHATKKSKNIIDLKKIHPFVDFVLLNSISYYKHLSIRRIINQYQLSYSFNSKAKRLSKPDLIICSIPSIHLAKAATQYAIKNNVPIILDIVDLWPDLFRHFLPKFINVAAGPYIWLLRRELKYTLDYASAITALTDSYLQWGLDYRTKPISFFKAIPFGYEYVRFNKSVEHFSIIFAGSITRQFDFDPFFEAAERLNELSFTIAGSGDLFESLKAKYVNITNLRWTGWLDSEELESELMNASIAIMPYKNLPHFQKNITNKFSEYLAYGLPILTSVSGEMLDLLEQHQCGAFYSSSEELVQHILGYKTKSDKLKQHSENARILQRKHFDIDKINKDFVDFIEEVHTRYHSR